MAAIPTAIRALMKHTVTLKVCTTSDAYGEKTLGAANTVRARIDYSTVRVLSQSGETVDSTTQVYTEDVAGFTLGGLSKSVGLPQAKLGWIAVSGDAGSVRNILPRLELACDTYLSVSTPVQLAAGELLRRGSTVRDQILRRVRANLAQCTSLVAGCPAATLLHAEGGWSAVLRVPTLMPEEELMLGLLTTDAVLVHAGYFFDFPTESFLVVSLLPPEPVFTEGLSRVLRRVGTDGRA